MSKQVTTTLEDVIRKHKCKLCGHSLSVPPIMIIGPENDFYKCGRCLQVPSQNHARNRLFEDIGQHLTFPCSYPQCKKKLRWGGVEEHEKSCRHRTVRCPIYYQNCSEVVRVDQLEEHFRNKHQNNIQTVGKFWDVNTNFDYIVLIRVRKQLFFVYILHLEDTYSVAVLAIGRSRFSRFNLKLRPSNGQENMKVIFGNLPVVLYDERSHCYMCFRRKCRMTHHPSSQKNKVAMDTSSFMTKIKKEIIDAVKTSSGDIRYCITLTADRGITEDCEQSSEEECDERNEVADEDDEKSKEGGACMVAKVDGDALRRGLTCPICMEYMSAPIYTCPTGHTIYRECKSQVKNCPTCMAPYGETRNYTLEEMTKEVKVPCQYDINGCTFVGVVSTINTHEMDCVFSNMNEYLYEHY